MKRPTTDRYPGMAQTIWVGLFTIEGYHASYNGSDRDIYFLHGWFREGKEVFLGPDGHIIPEIAVKTSTKYFFCTFGRNVDGDLLGGDPCGRWR